MNQGTGSIRIHPVLHLPVNEAYVGFVDFVCVLPPTGSLAFIPVRPC